VDGIYIAWRQVRRIVGILHIVTFLRCKLILHSMRAIFVPILNVVSPIPLITFPAGIGNNPKNKVAVAHLYHGNLVFWIYP
jgi:hypothetical protein